MSITSELGDLADRVHRNAVGIVSLRKKVDELERENERLEGVILGMEGVAHGLERDVDRAKDELPHRLEELIREYRARISSTDRAEILSSLRDSQVRGATEASRLLDALD